MKGDFSPAEYSTCLIEYYLCYLYKLNHKKGTGFMPDFFAATA